MPEVSFYGIMALCRFITTDYWSKQYQIGLKTLCDIQTVCEVKSFNSVDLEINAFQKRNFLFLKIYWCFCIRKKTFLFDNFVSMNNFLIIPR